MAKALPIPRLIPLSRVPYPHRRRTTIVAGGPLTWLVYLSWRLLVAYLTFAGWILAAILIWSTIVVIDALIILGVGDINLGILTYNGSRDTLHRRRELKGFEAVRRYENAHNLPHTNPGDQ